MRLGLRSAVTLAVSIAAALASGGDGRMNTPEGAVLGKSIAYDGNWWLRAEGDERSGFIQGAADCLTWTAHEEGFSATPEELGDKITHYYKAHPQNLSVGVVEVWENVRPKEGLSGSAPNAETWTSPHWYLNGLWWRQGSRLENVGFVEGYLWCVTTRLKSPAQAYSRPIAYYADHISTYIRANPKADDQAVATILERFRDQGKLK